MDYWKIESLQDFEDYIADIYSKFGKESFDSEMVKIRKDETSVCLKALIDAAINNFKRTDSVYIDGGTVNKLKQSGKLIDHRGMDISNEGLIKIVK